MFINLRFSWWILSVVFKPSVWWICRKSGDRIIQCRAPTWHPMACLSLKIPWKFGSVAGTPVLGTLKSQGVQWGTWCHLRQRNTPCRTAQHSAAQHSAAQRTPFRKHNFKENMQSNTAANHSSGSRSFAELLKKQLHHQPLWDCCGALGSLTPVVKTASTNLSLSVKFLFFSANRVL